MALTQYMPTAGCEHLDADATSKISAFRNNSNNHLDPDFATYSCVSCSFSGSFAVLNKHLSKTQHGFAVSHTSVYCGHCNDLIYDPALLVSSGKASAISSKSINGVKRKISESNDGEDDSYLTANTSQRPCGRTGVRGLFNLGETCYMNAVLQMMVHNSLLASYFLGMGHPIHTCPISKEPDNKKDNKNDSDDDDDDDGSAEGSQNKEQKTCVACGMTELFSDVTMVDQPLPAHAVNLLFASWKNIPQMSGKGQQDAQEWFICIIDRLHEGVAQYISTAENKSHATNQANGIATLDKQCVCFFHKVFYGRYNSQITCDTCHTVSSREDEFSSISLDFQKQMKKRKKGATKDAGGGGSGTNKESASKEKDSAGGNEGSKDDSKEKGNKDDKDTKKGGDTSKSSLKDKAAAASADLKITIPTIQDCLRAFTAPEPLSPEQYKCNNCNTRRSASKQTRIRKLPAILCVHVKRFGMKQNAGGVFGPEKYEGKIDFGLHLDMAPYTTRPPTKGTATAEASVKKEKKDGEAGEKKEKEKGKETKGASASAKASTGARKESDFMYDLDCVVVHQGEHAQNGHYFAFCRQDNKWFRFDDEIVSATTTEDVLRQEAYLLFYSLRSLEKI
ncbi:uncharacterized protein Z520_01362 [Fonsecaea multimorphosa CBS 102226]|uniref:ubiquitinyl hydrolase 1 n=1 Tax=Fonsecaea multimorphosa CBS 102226 TaxID=1442371 RepID=A0A0D2J0M9_9EURO|nr:uncharacterized protein Z520_01362 [Fonsecaea multimorphosa CBS 102226]KIY02897.1 hypothetical protein Z520_01362 [Fonsecaea multimorphosa CBS 102226]OAL30734.1 hypothetical protein AYO22_01354 [Fonsecaea multimorphosa]